MKLKIYIDEAGRGPLAWPLYVWAILPRKKFIKKYYKDSKILSESQREDLLIKIEQAEQKNQILYWYWIVSSDEIDSYRMTKALQLGVLRAVQMILQKLYQKEISQKLGKAICSCDVMQWLVLQNLFLEQNNLVETMVQISQIFKWLGLDLEIIIDWNRTFGVDDAIWCPVITIIKGDALIPEISMASIVAKVFRDHTMVELDKDYPEYNLSKHKGYWTKEHRDLISKYGPSKIHRKLFLKDYFPEFKKTIKKKIKKTLPKAESKKRN